MEPNQPEPPTLFFEDSSPLLFRTEPGTSRRNKQAYVSSAPIESDLSCGRVRKEGNHPLKRVRFVSQKPETIFYVCIRLANPIFFQASHRKVEGGAR